MQSKVAVSLILFLFPALVAPLFVLALLTKLPGPFGSFFLENSPWILWGFYLLLAVVAVFVYRKLKRSAWLRGVAAEPTVHINDANPDTAQPLASESPQE